MCLYVLGWNPFGTEYTVVYSEFFKRHLREVDRDMKATKYIETGSVQYQVNPHDNQS